MAKPIMKSVNLSAGAVDLGELKRALKRSRKAQKAMKKAGRKMRQAQKARDTQEIRILLGMATAAIAKAELIARLGL